VGALWRVDQKARNAPERWPGHQAGGAKEGLAPRKWAAMCFGRGGWGGCIWCLAPSRRAMTIGTYLDAVHGGPSFYQGEHGRNPSGVHFSPPVEDDRGSKKMSTRGLSRAHPCKRGGKHGRSGCTTVGVLLSKQQRTQGT
jgi:hypothetical protein